MKNVSLLTAFLGGACVGAALGLLYAPQKGSVLRAKLRRKGREVRGKLDEAMKRRGIHLNDDEIDDIIDDIQEDVKLSPES